MMRGPRRVGHPVMRTAATTAVVAGTAGAVHHHQEQRYEKKAMEQQQAADYQAMQQQAPYQAAAAPATPDYTAELQQLAQLHQQGILSDEEFEAKKKQILGI